MKKETVNHPEHYKGKKLEVIDIIDDYNLSFSLGNVIKYVLRAGKKEDAVEDLKKARWYLSREIDDLEDQIEQSTPVKEKPKAYHVTDEYSYKCLMKELEEQGYMFDIKSYASKKPTKLCYELPYGTRDYIYLVGGLDIGWNSDFNTSTPNIYNDERYDLIQYHKEEPRSLLQTDLTSENGVQYLSFDKKRRKYFIGALMTSENVQQKFTDSEILKIKSITRFAKLCEKVEVE